MRTIGILGGMSAASTALYYERLNAQARARLGGLHSADVLIRSVDFAEIEAMQAAGDWERAGAVLAAEARKLEAGGAELMLLATNTMHKVAEAIIAAIEIPFLHIADATAAALQEEGLSRPGVIATAYTMEQDFYLGRLRAAGLAPKTPSAAHRAMAHRIIYEELCRNIVRPESVAAFRAIAEDMTAEGIDSLILGCTEVGMVLNAGDVSVPVFDTTLIHCDRALAWSLRDAA